MLFSIAKCNLYVAYFLLLLHSTWNSLPFNKCLIFHYFYFLHLMPFFCVVIYYLLLFVRIILPIFSLFSARTLCATKGTQGVYPKTHQEAIRFDWLLSGCFIASGLKCKHNNNDYQKCFLSSFLCSFALYIFLHSILKQLKKHD